MVTMFMFYSPSTGGFYDPEHASTPKDAIRITYDRYQALLNGQSSGKQIVFRDGDIHLEDRGQTFTPEVSAALDSIDIAFGTEAQFHGLMRYLLALSLKGKLSDAEKADVKTFQDSVEWETTMRRLIAEAATEFPKAPASLPTLISRF